MRRGSLLLKNSRHALKVTSDVPYSSFHPRNVLDIYEPAPSAPIPNSTLRRPAVLFIHGGMWLRGDKRQPILSWHDMTASSLLENRSTAKHSNVGTTIAKAGGAAYVMNYRLAGDPSARSQHPDQVTDVARAVAFVMEREMERNVGQSSPRVFIGGHSAGAHLGALALSYPKWMDSALTDRGLEKRECERCIEGFFGISGVYNLSRLRMDPTASITVEPAFGTLEEGGLLEASPVHILSHSAGNKIAPPPLLGEIPILFLNAESDWSLEKDAEEMLVAMRRLDAGTDSAMRNHVIVNGRNHLTIKREFGSGLDSVLESLQPVSPAYNWGDAPLRKIHDALDYMYSSSIYYLKGEKPDETALRVLAFLDLLPRQER